jgi:hypothetical protein
LCITVALVPIVALFLSGDALCFVEFGEKVQEVHLARKFGPPLGAADATTPYRLVALSTAAAVEGFR